jgi:hypothetical protein
MREVPGEDNGWQDCIFVISAAQNFAVYQNALATREAFGITATGNYDRSSSW